MARATRARTQASTASAIIKKPITQAPGRRRRSSIFPDTTSSTGGLEDEDPFVGGSIFGQKALENPSSTVFRPRESLVAKEPLSGTAAPGVRKFSDLYGHGRALEGTLSPSRWAAGSKRSASAASETCSPKRVRFSIDDDNISFSEGDLESTDSLSDEDDDKPFEDRTIARRDLSLPVDFLFHPDIRLLTALSDYMVPISIAQISSLLRILQKYTADFAATYFADRIGDNMATVTQGNQRFSLADLQTKNYALYLTTVNVLDASGTDASDNNGWSKFFTHPNYRPFLVNAILAEWLTQRIFKDTAFGLSDKGRKEMEEDVDQKYIYHDAFLRAKKRSAVIVRHRNNADADSWLQKAACELADELMIVLAPMIPMLKPSGTLEAQSRKDENFKHDIWIALVALIRDCAVVNSAVVCSGEDGVIVRPAPRLEKGKQFFPTAPMECINQDLCEETRDDTQAGENDVLAVKMTCWPRMEAWVAHGMDMEMMGSLERQTRLDALSPDLRAKVVRGDNLTAEELKAAKKDLCWECSGVEDFWDSLPVELWQVDRERREKQAMLERSHKLRMKVQRAERRKIENDDDDNDDGDSDHDSSFSTSDMSVSSSSTETGDDEPKLEGDASEDKPPRGCWITEYTCLAPHTVYCEWVKPEGHSATASARSGLLPGQSIKQVNTLENAIKDARRKLSPSSFLLAQTDDLLLRLWNFYASHNLAIEWGTFLVAVLVLVSRKEVYGTAGQLIALPFKATTRIYNGICEAFGMKALVDSVVHADRFPLPEQVLSSANSYLVNNQDIFKTVFHNMVSPFKTPFSVATEEAESCVAHSLSHMTHFVGQRRPGTSNTFSSNIEYKSAMSSVAAAICSWAKGPSHGLGPVAAAFSSAMAATSAKTQTTPTDTSSDPFQIIAMEPENTVSNIEHDETIGTGAFTTSVQTTETTQGYATAAASHEQTTSDTTPSITPQNLFSRGSSVWRSVASTAVNGAANFLGRGARIADGGKQTTLRPGEAFTTVLVRGDRVHD